MKQRIADIQNRYNEISNSFLKLQGQQQYIQQQLLAQETSLLTLHSSLDLVSKAKTLLEMFVRSTESKIKEYIEPTATEALRFIFDQNLYFHLVYTSRRNQVEVDFIVLPSPEVEKQYQEFIANPEEYEDDLDEMIKTYKDLVYVYGGAIQEVLGLVLWLLSGVLLQVKGIRLLDEPTSAVHEEYASRVGVFIKSLCERFDLQLAVVTHSAALAATAANITYEVKKLGDISKVTRL